MKIKGKYVDGFLLVVPKKRLDEYKKMAEKGCRVWKKYGALDYKECIANDLRPQWVTYYFDKAMKAKKDEVVIFSYIVYKSRKHRDEVNAKVMKDPIMNDPNDKGKSMPFDMKRMSYGGFEVLVD